MSFLQWYLDTQRARLSSGKKPLRTVFRRIVLFFVIGVLLLLLSAWGIWVLAVHSVELSSPPSPANEQALRDHVTTFSRDFFPRSYLAKTNLERCVQYIQEHFADAGGQVSFQEYTADTVALKNVLALFPGKDARRIVVGAHYDTCGHTPGADDNASGVAGLLELARLLKGTPLTHTVELVAYCTEEPPFFDTEDMGSYHHAQALRKDDVDVVVMFSLEMIGYFSDEPGSQDYPVNAIGWLLYPTTGNFIGVLGIPSHLILTGIVTGAMRASTDLPVYGACIPACIPGTLLSDHKCYIECGYPAVMVSDLAFYRNKEYHETGDTPERLDYKRMANVVTGVFNAIQALQF